MFDFINAVKNELSNRTVRTENGATGYATTGHALLDMNFKVASYRKASENEILNDFVKAYAEDGTLALKWAFYVGDVREGLGERRLFRTLIKYILPVHQNLIDFVGEYNRFDSLLELFGTDAEDAMVAFVKRQLAEDMAACSAGKSVSLLAKWMPSANTSSAQTRDYARKFIAALGTNEKQYRKMLSKLRAQIDVIERKLCADQWDKVDYETVPSKANLKYKNAFLRNDETRRREFLGKLEKGEVKINAGVCFPHDIVVKYKSERSVDTALEGMWKALPDFDSTIPTIVVRDGSGSMCISVDGGHTTALDVSTALAIYFADRLEGCYKNKFITFSSRPELIDMTHCATLKDKLRLCSSYNDFSNTNIEATFDLLLKTSVNNGLTQAQIPQVLVISDMEFDCATEDCSWGSSTGVSSRTKTLFDKIAAKWRAAGYVMPKMVFWNVNSRTNVIPVKENELGVALVSGFSANIAKMVMSNETDPYKLLVKTLMAKRYEVIQ